MKSAIVARTVALPLLLGTVALAPACIHRWPTLRPAFTVSFAGPLERLGASTPTPDHREAIPPSRRIWAKHTNRSRLISKRRRRRRSSGNV